MKFGVNHLTPLFELNTEVVRQLAVYYRIRSICANKLTGQNHMNLCISCRKVSIWIRTLLLFCLFPKFLSGEQRPFYQTLLLNSAQIVIILKQNYKNRILLMHQHHFEELCIADLKISPYIQIHIKVIPWKFRILNHKNSRVIHP